MLTKGLRLRWLRWYDLCLQNVAAIRVRYGERDHFD